MDFTGKASLVDRAMRAACVDKLFAVAAPCDVSLAFAAVDLFDRYSVQRTYADLPAATFVGLICLRLVAESAAGVPLALLRDIDESLEHQYSHMEIRAKKHELRRLFSV